MSWSSRHLLVPLSAVLLVLSACGGDDDKNPVCGNGIIESGEACDDGNRVEGDRCNNSCQVTTPTNDAGTNTDAGTDAGTETDAGTTTDAGTETDAGTTTDAGTETDAGTTTDAGTETDAGTTTDAGTETDAGTTTDAGTETDAGSGPVDAGTDAGTETDAGTIDAGTDAGTETDAGTIDAGTDAGTETDAGTDGGAVDGGPAPDAGTGSDAGTTATLSALEPAAVFARSGTTGETIPEPLAVSLSANATTDVVIQVTSSSPSVVIANSGQVTVPAGSRSAAIIVTANDAAGSAKATLTATLGGDSRTATVRVLGATEAASLAFLSPETVSLAAGQTANVTVTLDIPAAAATSVALSTTGSVGSVPATVTVPANELSAKFVFTAGAAGSTGTIVATLNGQSVSAQAQVTAAPTTNHVVISEVAAAGPASGTTGDNDEFVELYNPTNAEVNIGGWKLQYKKAVDGTYTGSYTLPTTARIAAHGFFLIARDTYQGTVTPDAKWGTGISMAAGGGHVRIGPNSLTAALADPNVVDKLGYGTGDNPEGEAIKATPAKAGSYERKANAGSSAATMESGADATKGNSQDTDVNNADFILRTTRGPQNKASGTETP
ncbi:hypothetical protein HJC10_33220 [Corallococcus exiguus]|uniref:lamin tail domain-containing protein n=1 Tax=Corallococcus exiguus TaxID=83462 RepID=UPI001470C71A|nr:lamin tail domain-containing protein [Corallococcus exiguus]NNB99013.1 hypothetical protein [Corallococcus exiguus]NNC07692.1 hypothetical protein [Corallococcus exiguus]